MSRAATDLDGRHDFDFFYGQWHVTNRKLEDPLLGEAPTWLEFEATAEVWPILDGLGNVNTYTAPSFPGRGRYDGFALRLFDPDAKLWRIWWASSLGGGQLDTPLVGRFRAGVGRFECDDTIGGRDLTIRFDWTNVGPSAAHWEQAFSFDGGGRFETNWVMDFTRILDDRGGRSEWVPT